MISYETYKILHIFTLFMVVSGLGAILAEGRWIPNKSFKIILGVLSFLIFVAGMGLIARLGFKHGEPFPLWILVKIGAWILFNVALIGSFWVQEKKHKIFFGLLAFLCLFTAVYSAITKFL